MEATCTMKKIAIILAAGKNTRIKNICYDRPKCLLSVCGQTLITRLISQFWDYVDEFYIAAGCNAPKIASVLPNLNNIHILDFNGEDFAGNGVTLKHALQEVNTESSSIVILESDIVISDKVVNAFVTDTHPLKFIGVDKEINDHDDAIVKTEIGYRFTKERKEGWKILGKFIGVTELTPDISFKIIDDLDVPEHYAEFIARYSTLDFHTIEVSINDAMEIDTSADYSFVLNNYNIHPVTEKFNPYQVHINQGLQTYVGVYDVIGAKIARQYGIDGLYLGSYQISAAIGKKDTQEFSLEDALDIAQKIRYANIDMPIILDAMSGFQNIQDMDAVRQKIIECKIGAVCIDDLESSHECSLNTDFKPRILSVESFEERIAFAKRHMPKECKIIARTEIMNISSDPILIKRRIECLKNVCSDIVLPHYVGDDFSLLQKVIQSVSIDCPMMIIPSRLLHIPKIEWSNLGYQFVIYANADMRLRSHELEDLYEKITIMGNIEKDISDVKKLKNVYDIG